jgi:hypothetical protein
VIFLNEKKLTLPCRRASGLALRVNAVHDCLDDVKDFGDHFTASLSTSVRHPLGEGNFS